MKDGEKWVMAAYFPWGQDPFADIMAKFKSDVDAARHRQPFGVACHEPEDPQRREGDAAALSQLHRARALAEG